MALIFAYIGHKRIEQVCVVGNMGTGTPTLNPLYYPQTPLKTLVREMLCIER